MSAVPAADNVEDLPPLAEPSAIPRGTLAKDAIALYRPAPESWSDNARHRTPPNAHKTHRRRAPPKLAVAYGKPPVCVTVRRPVLIGPAHVAAA